MSRFLSILWFDFVVSLKQNILCIHPACFSWYRRLVTNLDLPLRALAIQRHTAPRAIWSLGVSTANAGLPRSLKAGTSTGFVFIIISQHYIWRRFSRAPSVSRWTRFCGSTVPDSRTNTFSMRSRRTWLKIARSVGPHAAVSAASTSKLASRPGTPMLVCKAYTNMASNYKAQFPQSGVRVLFVRTYPKRKESQSGKPIVEVVETLLKRALRADNRKVPRRGEEIFNIDPQELFGLIETLGTEEYQYDERRSSERLGKRLLWVITDTVTGTMKLMFAEDYDSVLKKFAESTDPNLLDDRTRLLTRYYIRPVTRNFPLGRLWAQPTEVPQEPTVEMPEVSADSTPIRVTRGSRIRPRDEDDVFSSPPPQRRGPTIPTGGGAGILPGRTCLKRLPHRGDDRPRRSCETRNRTTWISRGHPCSVSI